MAAVQEAKPGRAEGALGARGRVGGNAQPGSTTSPAGIACDQGSPVNTLLARLLLIVSVALVPALGFQAYTESKARHIREQLVRDEAVRLLRLVSAEQQRIVEGAQQVLTTISGAPEVQDRQPEPCHRLLANLLRHAPRYNEAGVIGLDGQRVCGSGPSGGTGDLSGRGYFRRALQTDGFIIGDDVPASGAARPSLHMAAPLRDQDGKLAGVVELGLDIGWLGQQLALLPLPAQAAASIADANGIILARTPDGAAFVGRPIPAADRYSLEGDAIKVAPMVSLDGRQRIAAYSPPGADPKGLRIWVGLDRDATFATVTQANRAGLLLIIAGGGLALALTALLGDRLIRRPVTRLLAAADRWRTGDLAARTGQRADGSEFARLAAGFDAMAAALQARERALRTALESTTDSVVVLDLSWRITYLSQRAKALLAAGREPVGQVLWDALPGTGGSIFAAGYREAMKSGVVTHTVGYSAANRAWLEAHAYPSADGLTVFLRDVTGEYRIAAALRESEQLFRATFEQAAVGMAVASLGNAWLQVNEKLCAITGYTRAELLERSAFDLTHPDDVAATRTQLEAVLTGTLAAHRLEKRYLHKDGSVVWVNATTSLLRDPEGRPERLIDVVEDITERKRVEAALRDSEARLRLAQEAAGIGIWEYDYATQTMAWSPEQYRLHGLDPAAGPPSFQDWLALVEPPDRAAILAADAAMQACGGGALRLEFRIRRGSDGALRWLASLGRLIRDGSLRPVRILGVNLDITERRQAEDELRRATALLRAIGNCSPDPIFAKDIQGRFLFANPALLAAIDRPAEDVIGRTDAEWHYDPAQAAAVMANDRRIIETGRAEVLEEIYDAAGLGKRVYRSAKAPLRMEDGSTCGIVAVSSDITQAKQAEAELRRLTTDLEARVREEVAAREAAQLRAAHAERLQALGQLAGGIAHDFNNVLQAVAGAAALIERRPDDAAGVRRLARLAIAASERGASITGRLLAFGRRADLRAEALDAAGLLHGLHEMLARTLGGGIEVQVSLEGDLPPLLADKGQLETVLVNLATNARDAMPAGGRLVLAAVPETVSAGPASHPAGLAPGRYVRLSVADTGTGMDPATLARATEPFFTTKPPGAGTGLGLAMAKGIAEQSGGGLTIESRPGWGTTVTLWLPAAASGGPAVAADETAPGAGQAAKPSRVLLVDDEDLVREVVAQFLREAGFDVLEAANGLEALALLDAGEPLDLLVTDMSMPEVDGLAVIRAAQARREGLPAVLLTGYASDESLLADGVRRFLPAAQAGQRSRADRLPARRTKITNKSFLVFSKKNKTSF